MVMYGSYKRKWCHERIFIYKAWVLIYLSIFIFETEEYIYLGLGIILLNTGVEAKIFKAFNKFKSIKQDSYIERRNIC